MPSDVAVDALRQYRARESENKKLDVLSALEELRTGGGRVTIAAVARLARVSREFIHSHEALHSAIAGAANNSAARRSSDSTRTRNGAEATLRADRATLISRVERDKKTITELKSLVSELQVQRRRWLGSQLDSPATVDPEAHAELRFTYERLIADAQKTTRQLAEARRLVEVLESDLAATRQAYSEDVERLSAGTENVVAFKRRPQETAD